MIVTKLLYEIDKNFDNFKHLVCTYHCLDLKNCKNINPVTRYICYKLYHTHI